MLVNYKIEYFNKAHKEKLFRTQFIEKTNWGGKWKEIWKKLVINNTEYPLPPFLSLWCICWWHLCLAFLHLRSRVARISQKGGAFWEAWNNSEQTWLNYHQSQIRLRRFSAQNALISKKKVHNEIHSVFLPKIRWSPKKKRSSPKFRAFFCPKSADLKKKKGLHVHWSPLSLVELTWGSSPTLTPISLGGYFCF